MGLHWFRAPKIVVEVKGGEIIVTMPGTSLSVVYEKTDDDQLIANSFSARKDDKRKLSLPKFLALAWTAVQVWKITCNPRGRANRPASSRGFSALCPLADLSGEAF